MKNNSLNNELISFEEYAEKISAMISLFEYAEKSSEITDTSVNTDNSRLVLKPKSISLSDYVNSDLNLGKYISN